MIRSFEFYLHLHFYAFYLIIFIALKEAKGFSSKVLFYALISLSNKTMLL